jgi:hypothetical protein
MAAGPIIVSGNVIENSAAVLLARIVDRAGELIEQAGITSMLLKVFDLSAKPPTLVNTPSGDALTVADVVFDTEQFDERWPDDEDGFNFALELDGDLFPDGNRSYQVEIKVVPTAGSPYYLLAKVKAQDIYSE